MIADHKGTPSPDEALRYSRHYSLPGFGVEGQQKLKHAAVAVVGAGGLGSPVLSYLAAAGVGRIRIIDFDIISVSNLQRQVLFTTDDIGQKKATVAGARIRRINPLINVEICDEKITSANALKLLEAFDVVVDCTDNFPCRYLLTDATILLGVPLVYGSIFRYEGQIAVFNVNAGTTYRDLFPKPPAAGSVPDCETGGVLGVLPGIIGSLQANEVVKILIGSPDVLAGRLLIFDSQTLESQVFNIPNQNQRAAVKTLIDYDELCGLRSSTNGPQAKMKEVTVQELKNLIDTKADFQLIDVREPYEYEVSNLSGELIPMADVPDQADSISKEKKVVIHCRSGRRSADVIQWLEKNKGYTNLYNLKGGIVAWAKEIEPGMPV